MAYDGRGWSARHSALHTLLQSGQAGAPSRGSMAEAADVFILFEEAARLRAGACGYSVKNATAHLLSRLRESRPDGQSAIRWRGVLRGQPCDCDPREGSAEFWRGGFKNSRLRELLSDNTAWRYSRTTPPGQVSMPSYVRNPFRALDDSAHKRMMPPAPPIYGFFLIELSRADVIADMPAAARARLAPASLASPAAAQTGPPDAIQEAQPRDIVRSLAAIEAGVDSSLAGTQWVLLTEKQKMIGSIAVRIYPNGLPPEITPAALKNRCDPFLHAVCGAYKVSRSGPPDRKTYKTFIENQQGDRSR